MRLEVQFADNKFIDIRLFDNPTVVKWFNHFKKLSDLELHQNSYSLLETIGPIEKNHLDQNVHTNWNNLLGGVRELKQLGYTIPFVVDEIFNFNQSTLNQWHRFFTDNETWYHKLYRNPDCPNPYDPTFKLNESVDHQKWLDIIDKINHNVHRLENYSYPNENKLFVSTLSTNRLLFRSIRKSNTELSTWLPFDKDDQQLNYTYFDYDMPLVILDESILGKSVLRSFVDDDDLNAVDCTGRIGSFGGIEIDLNNYRKDIFKSTQFAKWVAKHNQEFINIPFEFPIGYVNNFNDMISWINTSEYKKLVFID